MPGLDILQINGDSFIRADKEWHSLSLVFIEYLKKKKIIRFYFVNTIFKSCRTHYSFSFY